MSETVKLSLWRMLGWTLPGAATCGIAGVWPMYHRHGWPGVRAEGIAFVLALAVLAGSLAVIKILVDRAAARAGSGVNVAFAISQSFTISRLVNIAALAAGGATVYFFLPETLRASFILWLIGFYAVMLTAETWWLTRTLKHFSPNSRQ